MYKTLSYPFLFIRGHGCPSCSAKEGRRKQLKNHVFKPKSKLVKPRLTTSIVRQRINLLGKGDYKLIGDFVNSNVKIKVKHLTCGNCYLVRPSSFFAGERCPYCNGEHKKTTKQFKQEVYDKFNTEYKVLTCYKGANSPIRIKHQCGYIYQTTPHIFLRSQSPCPKCSGFFYNTKIYKEKVSKIDSDYIAIGEYSNSLTKVLMRHRVCGHTFYMCPNDFLNSHNRCPYCNQSRGERLIYRGLVNIYSLKEGKDFIYGYILPNKLHLDFYISSLNLGIEYDGIQHYKPVEHFGGTSRLEEQKKRDRIKDQYCKDNGIKLIRIPYTVKTYKELKNILSNYINCRTK